MGDNDQKLSMDKDRMEHFLDHVERMVQDVDGVRTLEHQEDGVYLTVYPPEGKGKPVAFEKIVSELKDRQINEVDEEQVKKAVRDKNGAPLRIAPPQVEVVQDGKVKVDLLQNQMEAFIVVFPPRGGKAVTLEEAKAELEKAGIVFGINEEALRRAVSSPDYHNEVKIAVGRQPEEGKDAVIEYKFNVAGKVTPKELEDGRVDFHNLNLIDNVNYGDILAVRTPPTEGVLGMTVTGRELPTKPGKDNKIPAGKNTNLVEDGTILMAANPGHVHLVGGKVQVDPVYELKGDVDFATGHINFFGTVIIRGNLTFGFNVECEGDLEVGGSIEGGNVRVGGNLTVKKGIQGQHKSLIDVRGTVVAKFIENATVKAGEDVLVGEGIMHSNIDAGRNIIVGGKKGVIVGGACRAGDVIDGKTLGSQHYTETILSVGIRPEIRQQYQDLMAKVRQLDENLDKTDKALKVLKEWEKKIGVLPEDKKILQLKLTRAQFQLLKEHSEVKEEKELLEAEILQSDKGKIKAQNLLHPGVDVYIGQTVFRTRDPLQFVTLQMESGEIKVFAYNQ